MSNCDTGMKNDVSWKPVDLWDKPPSTVIASVEPDSENCSTTNFKKTGVAKATFDGKKARSQGSGYWYEGRELRV